VPSSFRPYDLRVMDMVHRRRRPLGAALVAYGLVGIVGGLLVVVATISVGLGMKPTLETMNNERNAIVASLEHGSASLEKTAALVKDASGAVQDASSVASQAADVSRLAADTLTRLSSTFGSFSVLGNAPFAPLAADATQLAAQLRGIAIELDGIGTKLGGISRDMPPLADEISATATDLATVASELQALTVPESAATAFGWLLVGIVILVAWLLVPAVAGIVAGIALLRSPPAPA
jgi:hypothetical protein